MLIKDRLQSVLLSLLVISGVCQWPALAQDTEHQNTRANGVTNVAPGGAPIDDSARLKNISALISQSVAELSVPGYAIAIIKDGKVIFQNTIGVSDLEKNKPLTEDTIFGLASLTKTFTAMALLHLVEEGKINTSDTLDKYLNDIPDAWRKLTIFELASMRAGIPASRNKELPWPEEKKYVAGLPLASVPDTHFLYSNPSYRILGNVIEKVTGMHYLAYIHQTILQPLGMTSTGTTETMAATGRVSTQYEDNHGQITAITPKEPMASYSAGMLASSLKDMCIYARAVLDKKILNAQSYETYTIDRPALANGDAAPWAYGWNSAVNKRLGFRVISMNGGLTGVASQIILVPDQKIALVALANLRKKPVYGIARRALGIYLTGRDYQQDINPNAESMQSSEGIEHHGNDGQ